MLSLMETLFGGLGNYDELSFGSALPNGTDIGYDVGYDSSRRVEYMVTAGTYEFDTNFNPIGDWPGPWSQEWYGEVFDGGDEMPGTSGQKASFTSLAYQASTDSSWHTPGQLNVQQDQGCFGFGSGTNFDSLQVAGKIAPSWSRFGCRIAHLRMPSSGATSVSPLPTHA